MQLIFIILASSLITALICGKAIASNDCIVPIGSKQHYRYQWPLVFKSKTGGLYETSMNYELNERQIQVENGAEVLLSCGPNYLKNFNRLEELSVTCNGASGNFSILNETPREISIKELSCDLRVIEEVLVEDVEGCLDDKWTATKFGYVDPKEKMSYIIGEACYDMNEGRTIFAHTKLGDNVANYLEKHEKQFLTSLKHPDGRYKIELFRGLHFDLIYERMRQQLHAKSVPSFKMSNYIDDTLLSNLQFQALRKLGWNYFVAHDGLDVLESLKRDIQKLSEKLVLDVFIGSHGVQTLHGDNNEKVEIYLQQGTHDRFPMPAMIWFVVRQQQRATAFVIFNEATNSVEDLPHGSTLCQSDCSKVSWLRQTLKLSQSHRNALLCCSYEDLRNNIKTIPQWQDINEMLL